MWGARGGDYGRSVQDGCHEAAQVWTTETARVSSQGGLTQGRRVQEGQDPGRRRVCRMNRTQHGYTGLEARPCSAVLSLEDHGDIFNSTSGWPLSLLLEKSS